MAKMAPGCLSQLCACVISARRNILIFCFTLVCLFASVQFRNNFYVEANSGIHEQRPRYDGSLHVTPGNMSHLIPNDTLTDPSGIINQWAEGQTLAIANAARLKKIEIKKPDSIITTTTTTATTTPAPVPQNPVADTQNGVANGNTQEAEVPEGTSDTLCPEISPHLVGPITANKTAPTWEQLNKKFPAVELGGIYKVKECKSRHFMGIVIPFRNRDEHLRVFLQHMIPVFIRQQLDFGIYVAEQLDGSTFNRGMMMNVGFAEALKVENYACFIFTDVDLLIENDRNIYGCPEFPRHMSVAIDTLNYRLPYAAIFGGTENFRTEHYKKVNGFSNKYFGWGGEDDDLYQRVIKAGLKLIRPPKEVARYTMSRHKKERANPQRFKQLRGAKSRMSTDGLNTLKYDTVSVVKRPLITTVSVRVDQAAILKD